MSILIYNQQEIEQRDLDGYVNATQMAKVNNTRVNDWSRLDQTKAYIEELSRITHIPVIELICSKPGSRANGGGTWLHPLLALNFGRWISPSFAIWCDTHIRTLIETGGTRLDERQLPPKRDAVDYIQAVETVRKLDIPEALKQALLDKVGDELATKQLTDGRWIGCSQRAEELGIKMDASTRVQLGAYVGRQSESQGLERRKEKRYCNGQFRDIWVYRQSIELDSVINDWYDYKEEETVNDGFDSIIGSMIP